MYIDIKEIEPTYAQWLHILINYPESAEEYDWDMIHQYSNLMASVVIEHETYLKYLDDDRINGSSWVNIIIKYPHMDNRCRWRLLNGRDWSNLLSKRPELSDRCDWKTFEGNDWISLIEHAPQFADKCDIRTLKHNDWQRLIILIPSFAERCYRNIDWFNVVESRPELYEKVKDKHINLKKWDDLLDVHPQFSIRYLSSIFCRPIYTKLDAPENEDTIIDVFSFVASRSYEDLVEIENVDNYNWKQQNGRL